MLSANGPFAKNIHEADRNRGSVIIVIIITCFILDDVTVYALCISVDATVYS